ncbi:MAG: hypothetical protein KC621_02620 [Myxococcales bacterium]|nr:hypothetical protein [Myxococcales bacterium]
MEQREHRRRIREPPRGRQQPGHHRRLGADAREPEQPLGEAVGAREVDEPWAAVLDAPARIWVGVPPQELSRTLLLQAGWVVAVAGMARLVLARATRHLQIAGG